MRLAKLNPGVVATVIAIIYFVTFAAAKYLILKEFDWVTASIGAVVLWVIYYFIIKFLNKRVDRKMELIK